MNRLIQSKPLSSSLVDDLDGLFGLLPVSRGFGSYLAKQEGKPGWAPSVDIIEDKDGYTVNVELAGVGKDDIKIEVKAGSLTISGERKSVHEDSKAHRIERRYGEFSRSFSLPEGVSADAISADCRDGVLNVRVPKPAAAVDEARLIDIKGN